MKKIIFRENSGFSGSAEAAFEELERIRHTSTLTPENVVEYARDEDAYIHRYFEWDDISAAWEYRKHTARKLIKSIHVIPVEYHDKDKSESNPVFYNIQNVDKDTGKTSGYYQHAEHMTQDEYERAKIPIKQMIKSLSASVRHLELMAKTEAQMYHAKNIREKTDDLLLAI